MLKCRIITTLLLLFSFFINLQLFSKPTKNNNLTYDKYFHKFELRSGIKANSIIVKYRMNLIERVPDSIQKIIDKKENLLIVFFNGLVTDQSEMSEYKGVKPIGYKSATWDNVKMCQLQSKIFLGIYGEYANDGSTDYTLHEYGHIYDEKIGKYYFNKSLSDLDQIKKLHEKYKSNMPEYYQNIKEFMAYCIEQYYFSDITKFNFKINFREIYDLLYELENKSIDFYASLN